MAFPSGTLKGKIHSDEMFTKKYLFLFVVLAGLSCDSPLTETLSKSMDDKKPNRLIHEKSPYLLQHAYNPVDWYPWGPEAFEKAARENKPIFLSIGYSTCHWCHVMEHESFADPEVARLLNDTFICIKVDREERPDIDDVYMTICQLVTGSGGWPLTIFMTPDKKPFFAATYIPKNNRFGRTGLMDLIPKIKELWQTKRNSLLESSEKVADVLTQANHGSPGKELTEDTLKSAFQYFSDNFDSHYGGFGQDQKFPTPHNFLFLLRYWKRTGDAHALEMLEKTLVKMRQGGIFDHIGFGFHRYSTDPQWLAPHFEKMLYDQAMLAMAYTEAYQATGKEIYKNTAREIFTYVLRDMTAPAGGFYSAEDADSEGEEGKFYLWSVDEIRHILEPDEADLAIKTFNMEVGGNFIDQTTGENIGSNIPHLINDLSLIAEEWEVSESDLQSRLGKARQKLFSARKKRIHPLKDDKVLADWNGLMIAAFAKGARVFHEAEYQEAAQKALDFIFEKMRNTDGGLMHRFREGESAIPAYLDDYAFLICGLLELYETTFEVAHLEKALELTHYLLEHFDDKKNGGFYFTGDDAERLLVRKKEIYDGAIPSGNSVMMLNLLRLGRLTGNPEFEEMANRLTKAFSGTVEKNPYPFTMLLTALDFAIGPSFEVVIVGDPDADDTQQMVKALQSRFIPNKVVLLRAADKENPPVTNIAEFTKNLTAIEGKATAYVCLNFRCELPTTDVNAMLELLNVGA